MDKNPVEIIQREMLVFLFLSVVNIIFSAIALATDIVFLVNHLSAVMLANVISFIF